MEKQTRGNGVVKRERARHSPDQAQCVLAPRTRPAVLLVRYASDRLTPHASLEAVACQQIVTSLLEHATPVPNSLTDLLQLLRPDHTPKSCRLVPYQVRLSCHYRHNKLHY